MTPQTGPAWESPLLPGITFTVARVDPELAGTFLLAMDKQRNEVLDRSDRYALDMADHAWMFTGDPLRFDTNGAFIDGQHRCRAIVKSGIDQVILIIRGLHPDVMKVLDIGLKRTFTHLLQMAEVPSPSYVAAIAKAHFLWHQGLYGHRNIPRTTPAPDRMGVDPTHTELWAHFGRHPQLIEAARATGRMPHLLRSRTVSRTSLGLVWMLLTDIDPYKRDEFLGQVSGSVELTDRLPGYPPMILADRLTRSAGHLDQAVPQWAAISLLIRAWNAWVTGERIRTFRLPVRPEARLLSQPIDPRKWTPGETDPTNDEEASE